MSVLRWLAIGIGAGGLVAALRRWWPSSTSSSSSGPWSFSGPAEAFDPGAPETGCDPSPKPGVIKFRDAVLEHFGGYDAGLSRACDSDAHPAPSGHKLGRAWDWGVGGADVQAHATGLKQTGKPADVDAFLALLFAHDAELLRRAGVTYVIWQRKIWTTKTKGWQPYTGPDPHTDHVHFSFGLQGANGATSFYRALD